jgi:L-ascorbate metabolism protein UlaG (beta-lactamase superfamily)
VQITHFGHACVLVEIDGARILIDPGTYSHGFESLTRLDAILITHSHPDHLDSVRLEDLRTANTGVILVGDASLRGAVVFREGDLILDADAEFEVAGVEIQALQGTHEVVHPELASPPNTRYRLGGRVWHPGDSFEYRGERADVFLLPIGGPWMKLSDAIDCARAGAPAYIIPIHESGLAEAHRNLHVSVLTNLVQSVSNVVVPEPGVAINL